MTEHEEIIRRLDRIESAVDEGFREMNGRVRTIELWKAEMTAKLSVITTGARVSLTNFLTPAIQVALNVGITLLLSALLLK